MVLLVLVLGGGPVFAASSREERAYAAAVAAFHDGIYSQAETELGQFVGNYAHSHHLPEALLLKAQAQYQQGKYAEAMTTLSVPPAAQGSLADQYAYWRGEAQFARGDFEQSAETFTNLAARFPQSPLVLTSVVEAGTALARLENWPGVEQWLGRPNGVFALQAAQDDGNELVARGWLLLAQAQLAQDNFAGADATLKRVNPQRLPPALDWRRTDLKCRVDLGAGNLAGALAVTTNLLAIARQQKDTAPDQFADSVALRGIVLERMGRWAEAATNWQENLAPGTPEVRQREAILKLAADATAQHKFTDAQTALATFLKRFPDAPSAGLALLTLGELSFKQYLAQPVATNYLAAAQGDFDQLLRTNTAMTDLAGKAYLDRGWCFWLAAGMAKGSGDVQTAAQALSNSLADFSAAADRLPFSPDLAVAKFKMGDALFALNHFAGARTNYQAVLDAFGGLPVVMKSLGARALYQLVRTSSELRDAAGAERAMRQLLEQFPESDLDDDAMLLLGDGLSEYDSPTNALRVLREFARRFPDSPLRPEVDFEAARAYESARNWPEAITGYEGWLKNFPTNNLRLRSQVEYSLAWSEFQAGNETNALARFAGFVTQYPASRLAPLAQWWVADHYFRLGGTNFSEAEKNYEYIFQNTNQVWKDATNLFYSAQLMAGRSAAGRLGFQDAANYLTRLVADTNCPSPLATQALFAYGGVLMRMDSPDTNHPNANFELATNVFTQLIQANPTNELGALAGSELGDCDLQLGALDAATNAYAQVVNSPCAGVGLRCRAQVGLGRVLEKMAETAPPADRKTLQQEALKNYLAVFYTSIGNGLRDDETPEAFWVKKAGLQILPLLSADGSYPTNFFDRMESLLPQLKDSLEKKKLALEAEKN